MQKFAPFDIYYYYEDGRLGSSPEKPFVLSKWRLQTDDPEADARRVLGAVRPEAVLLRIEADDGRCELCRRDPAEEHYVKIGGIWYRVCAACYAEEKQAGAYTSEDAWEHVGEMLAGREA